MIDDLRQELLPLAEQLQTAGALGLRYLQRLPYDGLQWSVRRFQRDPFHAAFYKTLPSEFGSFTRDDRLFPRNRLLYSSPELSVDIAFRRRGSLKAFQSNRNRASSENAGQINAFPELVPQPSDDMRHAAIIWDVPPIDADHKATGPGLFALKLAKEGTTLSDNDWEGGFLIAEPRLESPIPSGPLYDPSVDDWGVDDEDDAL